MLKEARPPYVRFEMRQKEDRTRTIETGHYCSKEVIYVLVTPIGSGDTYNNEADKWLKQMWSEARAEPPRVPIEWVRAWENKLEDYKKSFENSIDGTTLRAWPMISPDQLDACTRVSCFTVEDLAALPEEGISALGMGGRDLKKKAAAWLQAATDSGKLVQENVTLQESLKSLQERNQSLEDQLRLLSQQVEELVKVKVAA